MGDWPSGVKMCKLRMSNIKSSSACYQGSHVPEHYPCVFIPGQPSSKDAPLSYCMFYRPGYFLENIRPAPPVACKSNRGADGHLFEGGEFAPPISTWRDGGP